MVFFSFPRCLASKESLTEETGGKNLSSMSDGRQSPSYTGLVFGTLTEPWSVSADEPLTTVSVLVWNKHLKLERLQVNPSSASLGVSA